MIFPVVRSNLKCMPNLRCGVSIDKGPEYHSVPLSLIVFSFARIIHKLESLAALHKIRVIT
jgi:hypothetical protein